MVRCCAFPETTLLFIRYLRYQSRRHLAAAFRAFPADRDARLHAADTFAVLGAFGADLGAFAACVLVVGGIDQHEMRRCPAYLRARHHQAKMRRLDMFSAGHQAMVHRGAETGPVAFETGLDAVVHLFGHLHGSALSAKQPQPEGKRAEANGVPAGRRARGGRSQSGPEPAKPPDVTEASGGDVTAAWRDPRGSRSRGEDAATCIRWGGGLLPRRYKARRRPDPREKASMCRIAHSRRRQIHCVFMTFTLHFCDTSQAPDATSVSWSSPAKAQRQCRV